MSNNNSKGTAITIQLARDLNKPVIVFAHGNSALDSLIRAVERPKTTEAASGFPGRPQYGSDSFCCQSDLF